MNAKLKNIGVRGGGLGVLEECENGLGVSNSNFGLGYFTTILD